MAKPPNGATQEDEAYFALSRDLMCRIGFDGRLERVNPAMAALVGQTEGELVGLRAADLFHPDDAGLPPLDDGGILTFSRRVRAADGSFRRLDGRATVDAASRSVWAVGVDVTVAHYAKRVVAVRQELSAAIEAAPSLAEAELALLSIIATSFGWEAAARWNEGAPASGPLIWTQDPELAVDLSDASRPGVAAREGGIAGVLDLDRWRTTLRLAATAWNGAAFEFARRSPERASDEEQAALETLLATGVQMLQRRSAGGEGVERRRAEQWFRDVVEGTAQPILVVDAGGRIQYVNRQVTSLTGYSQPELVDQEVEVLIDEARRSGHRPLRVAFIPDAKPRRMSENLEISLRRKDGSLVPVEISLTPLETESGTLVVAVIDDVTERRRAREERSRLNEELERRVLSATTDLRAVNDELEAFTYSVSHDLRTPLRAVSGYAAILRSDYAEQLPAGARRYIEQVIAGARVMGELIDDLLEFSQLGRRALERVPVDPAEVAEAAWDQLSGERAGRRIELSLLPMPPCEADPALLGHVYLNLFGNAIKYLRDTEDPHVRAGATVDEGTGEVRYFVADNGLGFEQQYAHTIFTVFQRLHQGGDDYEGTGVGLALVERIVSRHGGTVEASGEPGKGATISFTIGANPV